MLKLNITEPGGILFETTLEPAVSAVDKLRRQSKVDEGVISILKNKKNKVAVGLPHYENLRSRLENLNEEIPYEVKRFTKDYDFHYVRLSCSFLPDIDCKFEWARFGVELSSKGSKLVQSQSHAIAWDISPSEVLNTIKCKREISFTPELKFNIIPGIVDLGVETKISDSKDYVVYEPQITSFGLNRPNVIWEFRKTREKELFGNKNLLLIIRAPKGSKVKGRFLIGAEVASNYSRWLPFPVKNTNDSVVNVDYDLSE